MRTVLSLVMGAVLMAGTAAAQERTRSLVKYDNVEIDVIAEGRGPLIVLLPSRGRDSEDYDEVAAGLGEGRLPRAAPAAARHARQQRPAQGHHAARSGARRCRT